MEAEQELRRMINNRKHDADVFINALGGAAYIPGLDNDDGTFTK